jgi:hypothetical protein
MTVFDLDRYVVREYERFARSFTNIHARDLRQRAKSSMCWSKPGETSGRR